MTDGPFAVDVERLLRSSFHVEVRTWEHAGQGSFAMSVSGCRCGGVPV